MATDSDATTPSLPPLTVLGRIFAEEFLAYMAEQDEPETAAEAEVAAPCHLELDPKGGWAVLLEGESLEAGHEPAATFLRKEVAQIAAAVLPGTGRRLRYHLGDDPCERGFPVLLDGAVVGHSRHFHEELVAAMTVLDALMASPGDFAWLLDAMGGVALERAGTIMAARLGRA